MKILLTGGTGFIGREYVEKNNNHEYSILTRDVSRAIDILGAQHSYLLSLSHVDISCFDAVINLAGEPIFSKRWSESQKRQIINSRVSITDELSKMILESKNPPGVFISASAVGIYGFGQKGEINENSELNDSFSKEVCLKWEESALKSSKVTRVCIPRIGIVLGSNSLFLKQFGSLFNFFLGGYVGQGSQYVNWVHLDDMLNIINWMLTNGSANGVYNSVSPHPSTSDEFYLSLSKALRKPIFLRYSDLILNILFGEMAELITKGDLIVPKRLLEEKYTFIYKDLDESLLSILDKTKN